MSPSLRVLPIRAAAMTILYAFAFIVSPVLATLLVLGASGYRIAVHASSEAVIARADRRCRWMLVVASACVAMFGVGVTAECAPKWFPKLFLARVERNARPIVAAIDRFQHEHGRLPKAEDELVPAYLPEWPDPGLTSGDPYSYLVFEDRDEGPFWELIVWTGFTLDDSSAYSCSSSDRAWSASRD